MPFTPPITDGIVAPLPQPFEVHLETATATIESGTIFIGGGSASTITLADPGADVNGAILRCVAITAQAHVVTNASGSGFNGAGAGGDVGTFGGAIGDSLVLVAYGGVWHVIGNTNVTIA